MWGSEVPAPRKAKIGNRGCNRGSFELGIKAAVARKSAPSRFFRFCLEPHAVMPVTAWRYSPVRSA